MSNLNLPNNLWHAKSSNEVLRALESDSKNGLSSIEVQKRFEAYGPNQITPKKGVPAWMRFCRSGETTATSEALPSDASPRTTTPDPIFEPAPSASSRSIPGSTPSTFRAITATPLTSSGDSIRFPIWDFALLRFNVSNSFSKALCWSISRLTAFVSSPRGARSAWGQSPKCALAPRITWAVPKGT